MFMYKEYKVLNGDCFLYVYMFYFINLGKICVFCRVKDNKFISFFINLMF